MMRGAFGTQPIEILLLAVGVGLLPVTSAPADVALVRTRPGFAVG